MIHRLRDIRCALVSSAVLSAGIAIMAPQALGQTAAAPGTVSAEASGTAAKAETDAAKMYVDTMQSYYDKAKSYSATFTQDYETVDGIKKTSTGVVWFKKPGLMRWDYETPESRFLISDGDFFWSWEPVYRQYCKQNLASSQLPTALTFLSGKGKIDDDFNVSIEKIAGNQITLKLLPKAPSMAYTQIGFDILMPSARVYRVTILDAMGNTNRITFKSPEINAKLEDSSFRFQPPADATHICE
ncbi:MAG: outer membrane lipoprotein carrier protein LolA [Proteobacteria bacterium]|nr:outer membrane lipoprotein carrier protein LolA [Pseudomonadota bacterium]